MPMPVKRKNIRKKSNPGPSKTSGRAGSKKQAAPSLNLVLKRLDKIDQRLETLEQSTAEEFKAVREEIAQGRQETAAEFKAVRGEMAQGLDSLRQQYTSDMTKAFESFHQKFSAEMQKEFEKQGNDIKQYFLQKEIDKSKAA
jgi:hypothetical protein